MGRQFYRIKTDGSELTRLDSDIDIMVMAYTGFIRFSDAKPFIEDGRVLIPMRVIFERLDASVDWDDETQTITASICDRTITMQIGSNIMRINENEVELDVPAKIVNSRTFVPVRAVAEAFGATVTWDDDNQQVIIR